MIIIIIMKHSSQEIINAIILYLNDKFLKSLSLEFKNAGIRPVKFSLVDNDLTKQSFLVCECDYAKLDLCIDNIYNGGVMMIPLIVQIKHSAKTKKKRERDENNSTYHGSRNRQPIWNRNQAVGAGG